MILVVWHCARGVYQRPDGRRLSCIIEPAGETYKAVVVECVRGGYVEDPIRLAHWPEGKDSEEVTRHATFEAAVAFVERQARRWSRAKASRVRFGSKRRKSKA